MEKILEQVLLYDFYGELLTEHQRKIYEDAVCNDMSLGEIAQEYGISRQGVHDLVRRCDRILLEYESKLHLVERFEEAKANIGEIIKLTCVDEIMIENTDESMQKEAFLQRMNQIRELSEELRQNL